MSERVSPSPLKVAFAAAFLCACVAWWNKGRLPSSAEILPQLRQAPTQSDLQEPPFSFAYEGGTYEVEPKADYDLYGLVVTHNDIGGFGDIYHDSSSVDTKDLCVIWGSNVASDDFRRVNYRSGAFTCYFRYPAGVTFRGDELANNHLITDDAAVRQKIADVKVGDQIRLRGWLSDYKDSRAPNAVRRTSLTRSDGWEGACEVVFVKNLEILKAGSHGWFALYRLAVFAMIGIAGFALVRALFFRSSA